MDIYHVYCDTKPGIADTAFVAAIDRYMTHLRDGGKIHAWRLTRAQLDLAFQHVASRAEPVEGHHHGVNSLVTNATFALYRDFPDPVRQTGAERF